MLFKRKALAALCALGAASIGVVAWMLLADGLQELMNFVSARAQDEARPSFIAVYVVLCVISLVLIIPSGSLLLIAAGFVLGVTTATTVYSILHCLLCWPVFAVAKTALFNSEQYDSKQLLQRFLTPELQGIVDDLANEPFSTSLVLRLTPIVPSAAACIAAAALQIRFAPFFLATLLACWVRPLFYAAAGASLASLLALEKPMDLVRGTNIMPLVVIFAGTILLLASRLWLRRKKRRRNQP